MQTNEFYLGKEVVVKVSEDNEIKGVLKGISEDCNGKVTAAVEHMIPTRQNFELDKIS